VSDEYVEGNEGSPCIVVSHPWRFPGHPDRDPDLPAEQRGAQLHELIEELDRLSIKDDVLVFYDFCSLPQMPRTPEEDRCFGLALDKMHLLYTSPSCSVSVLPSVGLPKSKGREYIKRAWCFFELMISADCERICNTDNDDVATLLAGAHAPLTEEAFREQFEEKDFTNNGDKPKVLKMFNKITSERRRAQRRLHATFAIYLGIGTGAYFMLYSVPLFCGGPVGKAFHVMGLEIVNLLYGAVAAILLR